MASSAAGDWADALRTCRDRLAREGELLDAALHASGQPVAARRQALWRFGSAVRNAQHVLAAAERVQGRQRVGDRAVGRAYCELRRLVEDSILTGAAWRRQLAASEAEHERQYQAATR